MGFWDLSDGQTAKDTGAEYEVATGGEPIPEGSSVLAMIDEAKWTEDASRNRFISLRWAVLAPEAFKNRKIFHKLFVTDHDPSVTDKAKAIAKTDKARKMLAAIDANAGGRLTSKASEPTSDDLALALCSKPMVISLGVWESNNGGSGGNWVRAVAPKDRELKIADKKPSTGRAVSTGGGYSGGRSVMDDEIPF